MILFLTSVACVAAVIVIALWWKRRRRAQLLSQRLSPRQYALIEATVPLIRRLPADLRAPLEGKISLFLDQVTFIGCNGLEVSEEMELSIAAQAALLVVNNDMWYETLRTVLLYPGAFKSRQSAQDGFVVTERETVRLGESWARGPVILSWAHSERGAADPADGHNVVLHEFAHQIDGLSGYVDCVPVLRGDMNFEAWREIFVAAFERHGRDIEAGRTTLLDAYGAVEPEEFFAVAVEVFFEKPAQMQRDEPSVYDQLSRLFRLDPARWPAPA